MKKTTVFTNDLGERMWWDAEPFDVLKEPDKEKGYTIPIEVSEEYIINSYRPGYFAIDTGNDAE